MVEVVYNVHDEELHVFSIIFSLQDYKNELRQYLVSEYMYICRYALPSSQLNYC